MEYFLDNVIQTQIIPEKGITYPAALKSILRQDPDIIYCGEIRDSESSQILMEMAMTGHLVISCLYGADGSDCISRLLEVVIEPFIVSSAFIWNFIPEARQDNLPSL